MKQRIITGILLFAVLSPCLFFSHTWVLTFFVTAFSFIGAYELLGCVGLKKEPAVAVPIYLTALVIPPLTRLVEGKTQFIGISLIVMYVLLFYMLSLSVATKGRLPANDIAAAFAFFVYTQIGFASIIMTRDMKNGAYAFFLIFIGSWMTDIGAYFTGVLFGRHKLIPEVSPKKTVEGAVGGIVTCVACFCIYGAVVGYIFDTSPKYISLIVTALVVSIISMFGDLIASIIKRHYNIKDYGNIFPGHGGVIDRFDSVIAIAPFFVILNSISPFFHMFM